ncbi:hypothetical protein C4561_03135 [candidate division WWE3 bacterium]|jgi:uncharacterized membrane protein|uniref:DUF4870 domain-containing protein n=1 Tax=candidate division WWE3 bacterium TaxID=2053526 RepID=A0A3A4ZDB4_UNCKA|nr:MAG: hypothetical protein C4561_03135 [candidate division WWE3 bacterium]
MEEHDKKDETKSPLEYFEPNVAAALSYLVPPITGVVFFLMEKDNKYVKFHSFQSILFGVMGYALWKISQSLFIIYIGYIVEPVISIGTFLLWLFLIWKAYNNEEYELPYLGKIAKDQANKIR